jgi:hypothetical protein
MDNGDERNSLVTCRICGAGLPVGAMFCGECGSSTQATATSRRKPDMRPSDTTVIQPLRPTPTVVSVPVDVPSAPSPGASQPDSAGAHAQSRPEQVASPTEAVQAVKPVEEQQEFSSPAPEPASVVLESRFVLQFSTGETVSVRGTGLIGRRPLPQPAEHFDHLIQIADVGMSVSKSHLEFGQHDGTLWVSDRFSGNGTIVRRPGEAALRCEPGRRYLVPRGSRVEVADQFFVVS